MKPITVIETITFAKAALGLFSPTEAEDLAVYLAVNPDAGEIIRGAGGVRKLRWAAKGKGKRGGARVIYYYHNSTMPIFLITAYGKGVRANLSKAETNAMKTLADALVASY